MSTLYYIYRVVAEMPMRGAGTTQLLEDEPFAGPYDECTEAQRHAQRFSTSDQRFAVRCAREDA